MKVLILYYSRRGSVKKMARLIARGVESVEGCEAVLRTIPEIEQSTKPESGNDPVIELTELADCDGLIFGSPTHFGNMSSASKHFLDQTSLLWMNGSLVGKPAAVFTSSSSMHGGQESTLLSMINPLLHHGMLICGLPYTLPALSHTTSGGTPYGASHVAGTNNTLPISEDEKKLCIALGKRLAAICQQLNKT